ncbi:MAG: ABC transporter ATP-binding protein [Oscillospiraceae bacterium]|nr:ABC transporter ATP-binding protein [Oscillospiraceae bacterium]
MLGRFCAYYGPYKAHLAGDLLASFMLAACDLAYPLITRRIINETVPAGRARELAGLCAAVFFIYLIKLGFNYVVTYYGHILGVKLQADMRRDAFAHLQKLPFSFFDENKSGALMSRIVNDLQEISELAHHGPEHILVCSVSILGAFGLLCTINIPLTLIIFAFLPVFILIMYKMQKRMQDGFLLAREKTGRINAELANSLSGIRVSKSFDNEKLEIEKFESAVDEYKRARGASYKTMGLFYSWMYYFIDLMYLVVLAAGGVFYFQGRINIGDFTAYLLYIGQLINPVRKLMQFVEMFEDGTAGFRRFCALMDEEPEPDSEGVVEADTLRGDIEFRNVSFTYGSEQKVFNNINLTIKDGEKAALVGPSGAGKTTLCHLLPRFYDIEAGEILIGGRDISSYTRASLRRLIGIVQQEVFLFTGTIAENIAYPRPGASRAEIERAARRARIDGFIETLPEGYDSYVGERGVKLSGGQKQRVAIARVFLMDPQILILDEATSALDNLTEHELQAELDALSEGRTTIVVAHRLSTVRGADDIIVLGEEGVLERGAHEELLKRGGVYRSLYESQFV